MSGRYIISNKRNKKIWKAVGFDIINLTSLNKHIIELIDDYDDLPFDSEGKELLVRKISFLSGGHPRIISILISLAKEYGWSFKDNDNIIFTDYIKPHLDDIFKHNAIESEIIFQYLSKLSIFRKFNVSIIQDLQNKTPPFLNNKDGMDLISKLNLVIERDDHGFYSSDEIIRNLLKLSLFLQDPNEFYELNRVAISICQKAIKTNYSHKEFYLREIAYHALQVIPKEEFEIKIFNNMLKEELTTETLQLFYSLINEGGIEENNDEMIGLLADRKIKSFNDLVSLEDD